MQEVGTDRFGDKLEDKDIKSSTIDRHQLHKFRATFILSNSIDDKIRKKGPSFNLITNIFYVKV